MDQVISFVGRNVALASAVSEAQNAANAWLHQHAMAVGTIYSTTGQSIWQEADQVWYHVIMLTLEYRGATTPPTLNLEEPAAQRTEPRGKRRRT